MSTHAPIALFVFKRLSHLKNLIHSLKQNPESSLSDLYIFSDAARHENEKKEVEEVRDFIKQIKGFRSIKIYEQENNFGLAKSIIAGVSQILGSHEKIIVLEDDLVLSPHFLSFMNSALEKYLNTPQVFSISGYSYPLEPEPKNNFFIRGAECWGWATWKRAWQHFEENGELLLENLKSKNLLDEFDLEGSYPYSKMLQNQIEGKNDSWAIRFHASSFLRDGLTLFPRKSLVNNLGNDGSGTHCKSTNAFESDLEIEKIEMTEVPIQESKTQRNSLIQFYRSRTNATDKLKSAIKTYSSPVLASFVSLAVFFLLSVSFKFTLSTDDYSYLSSVLSGASSEISFNSSYFSRVPLWYIFNWLNFQYGNWSSSFQLVYFFFWIHSLGFALLFLHILQVAKRKPSIASYITLSTLFSLFPMYYEVLYWPTCMTYVPGLLFMAIAFQFQKRIFQAFFICLSLLVSEMYLTPAIAIACLPFVFRDQLKFENLKSWALGLSGVAMAFIAAQGIKLIASLSVSDFYSYPISLNPIQIAKQIAFSIGGIGAFHFYAPYFTLTLIFFLILGYIVYVVLKGRLLDTRKFLFLVLACIASTGIHWLVAYSAPRALYGAQIFTCCIYALLLSLISLKHRKQAYFLTCLLFLLFSIHSLQIFQTKTFNFSALKEREAELVENMTTCEEPCTIHLNELDKGLKKDWVLHQDYWISFARWVKEKNHISKKIEFVVARK